MEARGAYLPGANPARARKGEPKASKPLGKAPKYLSDEEKQIWKEIAKRLAPGVAMESDRDAFELMVRLTHMMRTNDILMKSADRTTLISLWSRFAMTPADRSKVSVEAPKDSTLDKFMQKHKPEPIPRIA
jgi:phage terminase small subunit